MPELPEVEQVRKTLIPHVVGHKILKTEVFLDRLVQYPAVPAFMQGTEGKTIRAINRRGKYLRLELGDGLFILGHLRMTGALIALSASAPQPPYAKLKFTLDGDENLWFTDIRTFGTLYLLQDGGSYKVNGYRVQVFAGGNSRNDRLKAERIGNAIKMRYPDQPVYVHFYSPRWICRVGNFRSLEEARKMLAKVKAMGYRQACLVKGKITVQY